MYIRSRKRSVQVRSALTTDQSLNLFTNKLLRWRAWSIIPRRLIAVATPTSADVPPLITSAKIMAVARLLLLQSMSYRFVYRSCQSLFFEYQFAAGSFLSFWSASLLSCTQHITDAGETHNFEAEAETWPRPSPEVPMLKLHTIILFTSTTIQAFEASAKFWQDIYSADITAVTFTCV